MGKRYFKIREPNGREIVAWIETDPQPLLPAVETKETESKISPLIFFSFFGWGFLGIALGNIIFHGGLHG